MSEIAAGSVFSVECPFVRSVYTEWDMDGKSETLSWKPGIEWLADGFGDADPIAHGMGRVIYRVIDVHKLPAPYPARVFYTRRWVDPEGGTFGKSALRITTLAAFRRRTRSYTPAGVTERHELRIVEFTDEDRDRLLKAA